MPDDQHRLGSLQGGLPGAAPGDINRGDRPEAMAFVTDADSEQALRDGLADTLVEAIDIRRSGIRAAIAAQHKAPSPRTLIVDVSGEEQPMIALARLSEVVEPDTCVLVLGDSSDLTIYRNITRGLGAAEYLAKPVTRDMVSQHFAPLVRGQIPVTPTMRGGRFVTITGTKGGVGSSLIAANLAWYLGITARRHTVLLDSDLHMGTAAFLLNTQPSSGLRLAIETPERIDALLAERAATPVADRLHVLSGQERLTQEMHYADGAAEKLLQALSRRYNFVVGDVRWQPTSFCHDLLGAAQHRVLVLTPTLAAVRDAIRMLPGSGGQQRATLVLNRLGMPGGMKRTQVEDILKQRVDVVIPDLPRQVGHAVTMGEPAMSHSNAFRTAISELARQAGAHQAIAAGGLDGTLGGPPPAGWRRWLGLK